VPVGPILLLVAAAASAATLISRLSNPVVRASLKDGFTKGEFDADFWSNAVGVVGDTLGMVPGVGAVARGVNGAAWSASAGAEALTLGEKLSSAGGKTWLAAQRIRAAKNPFGVARRTAVGDRMSVRKRGVSIGARGRAKAAGARVG
jgi:hypothetical protein